MYVASSRKSSNAGLQTAVSNIFQPIPKMFLSHLFAWRSRYHAEENGPNGA
ncbi:Uncharacterized protein BN1183_CN_00380 [Pantoea ananatis]|nr:Uncharacterized protein BN1183_CN_00380 [Pantoea ananatis]